MPVQSDANAMLPMRSGPLVSVDCAIFSVIGKQLKVLLVRRPLEPYEPFPGQWALPGGNVSVDKDKSLESAARRILRRKTAVDAPYLEQLGSWGGATRDPRGWSTTHVYFALLPAAALTPMPGGNAIDSQWFALSGSKVREQLAFDHVEILSAAIARLRAKVEYTALPVYLMPAEFTLTELQHTYEVILGRSLEKKSFRTRMLAATLLEAVAGKRAGPNRPAQLYRLKARHKPHYFSRMLTGPNS